MSTITNLPASLDFKALRQFAPKKPAVEQCDLCSLQIGTEHPHLLRVSDRQIACACEACAILFSNHEAARYKRIPRDAELLSNFELSDNDWDALAIPIGLAFFFYNSTAKRVVAYYPSPAGPTESRLDLSTCQDIAAMNPFLNEIEPDVAALLVNRVGKNRDYYIAPIDECYKLVGLIRTNWKGLSGGREVWMKIEEFFAAIKRKGRAFR
jgi:hypothetical protein